MPQETKKMFDEILKVRTCPLDEGEELALIEEFKRIDPVKDGKRRAEIINRILLSWDPQFKRIASDAYAKLTDRGRSSIALDDMIQEARLIALERIHKFDFEQGVKTITYLRPIIERSLLTKCSQNNPGLIRYPIEYERDAARIMKIKDDVLSEGFHGDTDALAEIVTMRLNDENKDKSSYFMRERRTRTILQNGCQQPISDQTPVGEDDEGNKRTIADLEPAVGEGSSPDTEVVNNLVREMKLALIKDYESDIQFRFTLLLYEGKTIDDIKKELGIKDLEAFAKAIGEDMQDYYIAFSLEDREGGGDIT